MVVEQAELEPEVEHNYIVVLAVVLAVGIVLEELAGAVFAVLIFEFDFADYSCL